MAPEQFIMAEYLLRKRADLGAVCEALGVTRRTLERAWKAKHGVTPARWRREHVPRTAAESGGPSPVVAFRFARWTELAAVASAVGVTPEQWARAALAAALDVHSGGA